MKIELKKGDYLKAVRDTFTDELKDQILTIEKRYEIQNVCEDLIQITDDEGTGRWFDKEHVALDFEIEFSENRQKEQLFREIEKLNNAYNEASDIMEELGSQLCVVQSELRKWS